MNMTMTTTKTTTTPTAWKFHGYFFGGEVDLAGTPIGDLCTGYFVTLGDDEATAAEAVKARYTHLAGRFDLRSLMACPMMAKRAKMAANRGGTKDLPLLTA